MKISIITAAYNSGNTIEATIRSVLSQRSAGISIEYIIVDGGSSDDTMEIVNRHKSKIAAIVSEPDNGIYDALNKGIRLSTGNVVGFLHADDCYAHEQVLTTVCEYFQKTDCMAVYGDLEYVYRSKTKKKQRYWQAGTFESKKLRCGWMPPHPTLFVQKMVYENHGLFNTYYRISADYEFMLRLLKHPDFDIQYIKQVLVQMSTGGTSNVGLQNLILKSREDLRAVRQHNIGGLLTIICKVARKIPQFFSLQD